MEIFTIIQIEEPDFGCEGCPDDGPVLDTVLLRGADGSTRTVTAEDAHLYRLALDEGSRVHLAADGTLQPAP